MRKWIFKSILMLIMTSGYLQAQDSFWTPQMLQIAETRSTRGWLYLKKNVSLQNQEFISQYGTLLGLTANSNLVVDRSNTDEAGIKHTHYNQLIDGLPVIGTRISFHERDNRIVLINGQGAIPEPVGTAKYESPQLKAKLIKSYIKTKYESVSDGEEVYFAQRNDNRSMTAKRCFRYLVHQDYLRYGYYYLDAYTGEFVGNLDEHRECNVGSAVTAKYGSKTINTSISGSLYVTKNDCNQEQLIVYNQNYDTLTNSYNIYSNVGNSWALGKSSGTQTLWCLTNVNTYFRTIHNRISINELPRTTYAMANCLFNNGPGSWTGWGAFFSNDILYFGGNSPTTSSDDLGVLDVVGHEYTHGVTKYASSLAYTKEMGAINESFSDIFGEIVENWTNGSNNWLLGTDCGSTIRSFINPNVYSQPSSYQGLYWHNVNGTSAADSADNFGVHTNSGVQNYMFYLMVNGGSDTNSLGEIVTVQPLGLTAGRAIAYSTLQDYIGPSTDYYDARKAWLAASDLLYGWCSNENLQVALAWDAVGVFDNVIGASNACGTYPYNFGTQVVNTIANQYYIIAGGSSCTNTIVNTAPVSYSASQFIQFLPGFRATSGSNFIAKIDECNLTLWRASNQTNPELIYEESETLRSITQNGVSGKVAPNPFTSSFKITLQFSDEVREGEICITDGTGRLLIRKEVNAEPGTEYSFEPSTHEFPAGVYFVYYRSSKGVQWQQKLVKM